MTQKLMQQLEELRPASNKWLNPKVVSLIQNHVVPLSLVKRELIANGKWIVKPRKGLDALAQTDNQHSKRRLEL